MRTSGKTNSTPGEPSLHRQAQGEEEKLTKRGAKVGLGVASLLFECFGSACPQPWGCIFLYFLNKTELWHGAATLVSPRAVTRVCRFKFFCGETEPRKWQPLPTLSMNIQAWFPLGLTGLISFRTDWFDLLDRLNNGSLKYPGHNPWNWWLLPYMAKGTLQMWPNLGS